MYSLNLLSCLILMVLGSIYVLTKPLSIENQIPTDSSGLATPDKIFLDDIALALVQNFDEESSSDDEGLVFDEGHVPADNTSGNDGGKTGSNGSNGSIIGSDSTKHGSTSGNGNTSTGGNDKTSTGGNGSTGVTGTPKPGVVTSSDGTTTDLSNAKVNSDGKVTDSKGNTVATVDKDGKITDSKGNVVGTVDKDGNVVDNNGNTVASVDNDGNVAPVAPVEAGNNNVSGNPKPGVVTAPDGTTTDFSNTTVKPDGKIVDSKGNTVGTVDKDGKITDSKGNVVGTVDKDGKIVDNKGNTIANVDKNGKVNVPNTNSTVNPDGTVSNNNQGPEIVDSKSRDDDKNNSGGFLYFLLPALALVGGAGAFLYKNKYVDDILGKAPIDDDIVQMSNIGAAPTAAAIGPNGDSTTAPSKPVYGSHLPYDVVDKAGPSTSAPSTYNNNTAPNAKTATTSTSTTRYGNMAPAALAAPATSLGKNVNDVDYETLPAIESGPSMETLTKEFNTTTGKDNDTDILPAVMAAAAAAGAAATSKKTNKSSKTTTYTTNNVPATENEIIEETRYGPVGTTKNISNVQSAPRDTISSAPKNVTPVTSETYSTNNVPSTTANSETYTTKDTLATSKDGFDSKYLLAAAPLAAGAALLATKKDSDDDKKKTVKTSVNSYNTTYNKEKAIPIVPVGKKSDEEEIIEEYIVEQSSKKSPKKTVKKTTYKTIYRNGVPVQVPVDEADTTARNVVAGPDTQEEIIEEYIIEEGNNIPKTKTIYKNGVPVIVPIVGKKTTETEEETRELSNVTSENKVNPYMGMIPMVIETIVKHATSLGDKSDDEKKNDLNKLIGKVTEINPDSKKLVEEYIVNNSKGPKKTIKRTVYKTIYKNGVPVEVPVEEEVEESESSPKSLKSPKLKGIKKRVTTYISKDGKEIPMTEEFSLNPKDVSSEELPEEYKDFSTEETIVSSKKSPKHKTIKKYITVYKTIYKNGKPEEVVENIEVPEGKTPEEVLATLPRGTHIKPKTEEIEKRYVTSNVIEAPTKESVIEEREVNPTTISKPKVHSVKKFVTTYKTTYKNGVPVEEVTESEDLPDQSTTETTLNEESLKSPKLKTIKKITTYKTIYKNGKPIEVVEEEPEEIVLEANPALVERNMTNVQPEEDTEETLPKGVKKTINKKVQPGDDSEEIIEEYIIENGVRKPKKTVKKTIYKTIYKNGVPVQVPVEEGDREAPVNDDETEEIVEEYVIEDGVRKPKKTVKKTIYKTIYKNGVPVQVPVDEGDREAPVNDDETEETVEEYVIENGVRVKKPKKTIKKTIYKTIYKNGVPVQVPIDETEAETLENVTTKNVPGGIVTTTTTTTDEMEEIVEEYLIEEGSDGKPRKTVKRTTYRNGVPVNEEYDEVSEIPDDAMETEEIVEEYEIEEGKNQPPKTLKKTVYKTIYQNGVAVKVPVSVDDQEITSRDANGSNPYMKLVPSIIETIVKYAIPGASDNDGKDDLEKLMSQVTEISNPKEVPESNDREVVVNDMVSNAVTNTLTKEEKYNPYMKLAPTIIQTIVKYALPNADEKDGKADLAELMSQVAGITKIIGNEKEEAPKVEEASKTESREATDNQGTINEIVSNVVASKTDGDYNEYPFMKLAPSIIQMIVKYALPDANENDGKADFDDLMSQVDSITKLVGKREVTEGETREVATEGEEIVEEYLIEEDSNGKPRKTVKRTTYKNGVPVSEEYDEVSEIPDDAMETEEIVEEYEIEEGKDQSPKSVKKTVYKNGVQVSSEESTGNDSNVNLKVPNNYGEIVRNVNISKNGEEEYIEEYSEILPSITEEDESLPMEDSRILDTTSPTETRSFRRRQLPKRSSSKRLSAELRAAVAAELLKLENEINDETKQIPRPRKQSMSQSLSRKESKTSIKAMAEGCLVRKPSNASSIKSNHSVEDWSGPVFEKKVFEVIVEHVPQLPDEVKLNIGDLVEVKQVFEDGWAYGINTATKIDGTFPVICLGEEREPNKNGRYVPRLIRVFQAREEAGKKEIEDEEKFKQDLTEFAKKKKEYKLKKQAKRSSNQN
ncbi:hypothetical protein LY90DRAFT_510717 [Neocallimastix californiae]|jgi:hypothetical protein|uniref:SH3 domain-containing protein n=1 Tax=Neocallimastix californiae TaxID=1754190 RepID=A0A1Y2BWS6_9FUNG|nr:hypothetical protein LY90DRAFT_510717 [Neocallimastix californiae]|eukprot:ORY39219.1 hypothetical protein LY90DRAFT_510717 [Neocallimastix californiae]